jgi:hypothetical protein
MTAAVIGEASSPATAGKSVTTLIRAHPVAAVFMVAAVASRLVFWLYTGRIWEDAMISLSAARNVWLGVGLTHHASEPYVHSFTSALGELILIVGEACFEGGGLLAMRLVSIVAGVAAIYYAYRITVHLRLHWAAQCLVLGYLAFDHLQIFFGMSGMETQVAVALSLANAYYYLASQFGRLGLVAGLAALCRPELALWGAVLGPAMLIFHRRHFLHFALAALAVTLPWILFAWLYYGTPVPHTIVVKSHITGFLNWGAMAAYIPDWWRHIAPFFQYCLAMATPLSTTVAKCIVGAATALALAGAVAAVRVQPRLLVALLVLVAFVAYRTTATVNAYYMWYLPPFTALFFLFVAAGTSAMIVHARLAGIGVAAALLVAYSMHLPYTLQLDRRAQADVETGVRVRVGKSLNGMMQDTDSVVLEPLGFIGWEAKNKTIYDFPGLGSPKAFAAFLKHPKMPGMVRELSPRFVVMRPRELAELAALAPDVFARYEAVERITARSDLSLSVGGLRYDPFDGDFTILRRRM